MKMSIVAVFSLFLALGAQALASDNVMKAKNEVVTALYAQQKAVDSTLDSDWIRPFTEKLERLTFSETYLKCVSPYWYMTEKRRQKNCRAVLKEMLALQAEHEAKATSYVNLAMDTYLEAMNAANASSVPDTRSAMALAQKTLTPAYDAYFDAMSEVAYLLAGEIKRCGTETLARASFDCAIESTLVTLGMEARKGVVDAVNAYDAATREAIAVVKTWR